MLFKLLLDRDLYTWTFPRAHSLPLFLKTSYKKQILTTVMYYLLTDGMLSPATRVRAWKTITIGKINKPQMLKTEKLLFYTFTHLLIYSYTLNLEH